jgi:hypothetical protein
MRINMSNYESRGIAVPGGMLDAAVDGIDEEGRLFLSSYPHWPGMLNCLRNALAWQRDNPLVPTMAQARVLRDLAITVSAGYGQTQSTAASERAVVLDWVRHMYDAPEPQPVSDDRLHQLAHDPFMCNITDEVVQCLRELEEYRIREAK